MWSRGVVARALRLAACRSATFRATRVRDFLRPDRIVIGADDACAAAAVGRLYAPLEARVIYCSRRAAETAKYAANTLLATRISLMNEIAQVCDAMGVDVAESRRSLAPTAASVPGICARASAGAGRAFRRTFAR
jgi:UDP-N-acetyl-D-mannosaminuronate dehydrogenase